MAQAIPNLSHFFERGLFGIISGNDLLSYPFTGTVLINNNLQVVNMSEHYDGQNR
ncbi:hypothetical protein LX24_02584 [Desulfallas thermosapovorans DSM 6562]|uniref:Uncharacterized protein n=1 Tax=Desulfallas thermosapovorans DSM 6562 TaxID=1121431 RepID=A0A5S4ZPA8_9FIRM|nr:hypothetical protein LX24_02584 [Desulfallas thermosapovorans DSM 6562]